MAKRVFDIGGALVALGVTWPLWLVVAIAIKLDSPGPVLFTSLRVGRHGRLFRLYKFRSMFVGSDVGPVITVKADPRTTRVGRLLRPLRIDELPQFINVLKGDMSLVGPRPEPLTVVETYTPEQRRVLNARPGITGPTQLAWIGESERFPPGTDPEEYYVRCILPDKLQSDLRYVRTRTLLRDLGYLIQTPIRLAELVLAQPRFVDVLKFGRFVADLSAVTLGVGLAFAVRFDGHLPASYVWALVSGLPLVVMAYGLAFIFLRIYRASWSHVGVEDLWTLAAACLLGGALSIPALHFLAMPYPWSVMVLGPVLTVFMTTAARLTWRMAATVLSNPLRGDRRRVVIVGAGRRGETIARKLLARPRLGYTVAGFVDDDLRLKGTRISNVPVLGTCEQLEELVERHRLETAVVAIPRLPFTELRRVADVCRRAGIDFKIVRRGSLDDLRLEALWEAVELQAIEAFIRDVERLARVGDVAQVLARVRTMTPATDLTPSDETARPAPLRPAVNETP